MTALGTISQLVGAFKPIQAVLKAHSELNHFGELDAAVSAAYSIAIDAQTATLAIAETIDQLRKENTTLKGKLSELKEWKKISKEYALSQIEVGIFVYRKESEPDVFMCTNCFTHKKLSILQTTSKTSGESVCPMCKFELHIKSRISEKLHFRGRGVISHGISL